MWHRGQGHPGVLRRHTREGRRPPGLSGLTWGVAPASRVQENERTKDLVIEQRFHRTIIGQKGERIREIRDKFPEVRSPHSRTCGRRASGARGHPSSRQQLDLAPR